MEMIWIKQRVILADAGASLSSASQLCPCRVLLAAWHGGLTTSVRCSLLLAVLLRR